MQSKQSLVLVKWGRFGGMKRCHPMSPLSLTISRLSLITAAVNPIEIG